MRKKILIYSGINLFPKIMASQDRIINMIIELSKQHCIDLVMKYRYEEEVAFTERELNKYLTNFYPIKSVNPYNSFLRRKYFGLNYKLLSQVKGYPTTFFYQNYPKIQKQVIDIVEQNDYDIFQVEYWYFADIFKKINVKVLKVIDMHMISFDDLQLYAIEKYGGKEHIPKRVIKKINRTRLKEIEILKSADLLIPISANDKETLKKLNIETKSKVIYTGQNIIYFSKYPIKQEDKTIIFYGSMGGKQNIIAFHRFWKNIYPLIIEKDPYIKVLIIGSHPPKEIKELETTNTNVRVTGFVDDVRKYISKGKVMIIPLEVGVGFRSRVVEVMAMGVPVVGTHNALDNLEMEHGEHGFISESNQEMAEFILSILSDNGLHKRLSENALTFVKQKYSSEATYGVLSEFYSKVKN